MNYKRAFTLLEILIVVAVIGLLATVVMYGVSEARVDANDKHKKVEVKQVATAIEVSSLSGDGVPGVGGAHDLSGSIGVLYNEQSEEYQNVMQELVSDGYYPEIPRSPSGEDYFYMVDSNLNGVFGAVLYSDKEDNINNGCYFSNESYGCSGDSKEYAYEYNKEDLEQSAYCESFSGGGRLPRECLEFEIPTPTPTNNPNVGAD